MLKTPAQVARVLGISPSTLRRYSEAFAGVLSTTANPPPGRRRMYSDDDLGLLRHARDMLQAGRSMNEVADVLPTVELDAEAEAATPTDPEASALAIPADAGRLIDALATIASQRRELDRMAADIDALNERLSAVEKAHKRPRGGFIARLLGRDMQDSA